MAEANLTYEIINTGTLEATEPPGLRYYLALMLLAVVIGLAFCTFVYQVDTGMGVTGLNHPTGWAVYIGNFVFWVGIAHSGTLISAILHLVRARWRNSVSRSAEAMTIFAILTAGCFPLVHLGRFWVFYYIIPYPSQRHIWPNFLSPLVWDECAVGTYFTVSLIFWYMGLIPDAASARDRALEEYGPYSARYRIYRALALGWSGAGSQWRHYSRAYLFFAALATPLVISVHSVVSFDFAMANLPGWHTTIFAPYFVAGAIHSGLAMVLTLVIPMRRLLNLKQLITQDHLEYLAETILVTTAVVGYAYIVEPFIAWYSGDVFERQFAYWRAMGGEFSWVFWAIIPLNVLIPALFVFKKIRRSIPALFIISIFINAGMWLERYMIVAASTTHDFLPHNWGWYRPTWVEFTITVGSFAFFFCLFLIFSKVLPVVPMADLKEHVAEKEKKDVARCSRKLPKEGLDPLKPSVLAIYPTAGALLKALREVCEAGFKEIEFFSPVKLEEAQKILGRTPSPVRYWTFFGAVSGLIGGYSLAIGTALVNRLIAGGKHPISVIPYFIIGFEGTILLGTLFGLAGLIINARLHHTWTVRGYDRRFSNNKFGIFAACEPDMFGKLKSVVEQTGAEEMHLIKGRSPIRIGMEEADAALK